MSCLVIKTGENIEPTSIEFSEDDLVNQESQQKKKVTECENNPLGLEQDNHLR